MTLFQQIQINALAELGYEARPTPGHGTGIRSTGIPCEPKWKASNIARQSTGGKPLSFEQWHAVGAETFPETFHCNCGLVAA